MVALDQLVPKARCGFLTHALQHQRHEGMGWFVERLSRIAERADAHALIGSLAAWRGQLDAPVVVHSNSLIF